MESLLPISAVLFDMNGVLVDDEILHEEAFRQVLDTRGVSLSAQEYADNFMGRTDRDGFSSFFGQTPSDIELLLAQKSRAYQGLAAGRLTPYPGVVSFVSSIAANQIPMAIVTSSTRSEADAVVEAINTSGRFLAIIAADDVEVGKPDPQGYLMGAAALDATPENCLVVEDAPSGIEAAKRAGMRVLAITNTHEAEDLSAADLIVDAVDGQSWASIRERIP